MVKNRTLFPSTVVEVTRDAPDRILVSGQNNRKLGGTIVKGTYAGYALYGLSLEERATCPSTCSVRGYCYGNGMQMARRHRIVDADVFYDRLTIEIGHLLKQHDRGIMIRLHVLGDFPSVEYVAFWSDILSEYDRVACYGYTHRLPKQGAEIGNAIASLKAAQPDRFRIRWSSDVTEADSARIISYVPQAHRVEQGIVCPAQVKEDACCASCAFCWEPKTRLDNVAFIMHGAKSAGIAAQSAMAQLAPPERSSAPHAPTILPDISPPRAPNPVSVGDHRRVGPIAIPSKFKPNAVDGSPPEMRLVTPSDLLVEPAYQRDLSGRSVTLIRKIVSGWDWAKFKPPVCAETDDGLFVIDGQHTAIAAASHPSVPAIPVMVVGAEKIEQRAEAFVAHNRDRLAMSALQIFHAEVAAGGAEARAIMAVVTKVGATVPRTVPLKDQARLGQIIAINEVRAVYRKAGSGWIERIVRIALLSKVQPIGTTVVRALRMLLSEQRFFEAAHLSDAEIADALGSIANVEMASQRHGAATGQGRYRACVMLILEATKARQGRAA